jgi:hypothetical protein
MALDIVPQLEALLAHNIVSSLRVDRRPVLGAVLRQILD